MDVLDAIVNRRFQLQIDFDVIMQNKPIVDWIADETMNVQYDLKARNILNSAIRVNEYHSVLHCKTVKAILYTLKTLHEGTEDVKQTTINTLT
jgi:hypothetical protein